MPSKLRAPIEPGELGRVVQKIYDDLNQVIDNINTDLEGSKEPDETNKAGSIAVVKEGDKYSIRGKTEDGWAKAPIKLLNSTKITPIFSSDKFEDIQDIVSITDSTGGTVSNTIDITVSNYKDDFATLGAKINELIEVSNVHNDRINTLIDKVNEIIEDNNG
tara:strand:- start:397 stop:882 length:486 start_codon:yes stop_codon:yes gene_type:complete